MAFSFAHSLSFSLGFSVEPLNAVMALLAAMTMGASIATGLWALHRFNRFWPTIRNRDYFKGCGLAKSHAWLYFSSGASVADCVLLLLWTTGGEAGPLAPYFLAIHASFGALFTVAHLIVARFIDSNVIWELRPTDEPAT